MKITLLYSNFSRCSRVGTHTNVLFKVQYGWLFSGVFFPAVENNINP